MDFGGDPYYFAARLVNPGTLILIRPKTRTGSLLSPYAAGLLVAAAAGGLLAALAAFLLARRISRPVGRVAAAARSLTRGTHPEPVPVEGATEIATLAVAFNDLAAQLRQAQEAERNFLLSVSHELKTPLTAIRGYAEAVEDGALDPRDAAATVASEARRLERLVHDLLDLARINRTDFSVRNTEIDLAEVAEDAVRRYQQQAESFGVSLLSDCGMLFRREIAGLRQLHRLELARRSAYVLAGAARSSWQHRIPATPGLRYSVTFRTVRAAQRQDRVGAG